MRSSTSSSTFPYPVAFLGSFPHRSVRGMRCSPCCLCGAAWQQCEHSPALHFHPTSQHPCVAVPVWHVVSLQWDLTEQFVCSNASTVTRQMCVQVQKVSMLTSTACSARQETELLCCVWPPYSSKTLHVLGD